MSRPPRETAAVPYRPEVPSPRTEAGAVKQRHEAELLGIDGVEGVGLGSRGGHEVILTYVRDAAAAHRLPEQIEGGSPPRSLARSRRAEPGGAVGAPALVRRGCLS